MSDLYKESIADAKALKELAHQNAREILSNTFSDQLEEAVNSMLNEGSKSKEKEEKDKDMDETSYAKDGKDGVPANNMPQPGEEMKKAGESKKNTKKESSDSDDQKDSMDELESFLDKVDSEINEMRDSDKKDKEEDEKEMDEKVDSSNIGRGDNAKPSPKSDRSQTEDPQGTKFFESMTKDDLLAIVMEAINEASEDDMGDDDDDDDEMDEKYKKDKKDKKKMKEMSDIISNLESELSESNNKVNNLTEKLEEAENVIDRLSNTITEANLLNSKLLYVNKLNNEFELDEGQKEKILNKINEGENLKEVKLIYSVLKEGLDSTIVKKPTVNESSNGSASGVIASTAPSKDSVDESSGLRDRFQILAGIKKSNLLKD